MTGLLARAAALIVEPRPVPEGQPVSGSGAGIRGLVLGAPADAPAVAGAFAGALRARERAPAALVCAWVPQDAATARPAAAPWTAAAARRLAERLIARGLAARAAGRLAWLELPAEPVTAASVLTSLLGWLDAPVVSALAGPRTPALDDVIAAQDVVVAVRPATAGISAAASVALAALALEDAGEGVTCDPLPGALTCRRARAGLARLPADHPALAALAPSGATSRSSPSGDHARIR